MRLLANENFPKVAVVALRAAGHDVTWIPESVPSTHDRDVLHIAMRENRVLVTLDKDFGELAFREGLPATCGVNLFRLPAIPSDGSRNSAASRSGNSAAPRRKERA